VLAWPTASTGAARVARVRARGGPPRPRPTGRARRLCPAARGSVAALLGEPVVTRHRRTGDDGDGGSLARRRRRAMAGATTTGAARRLAAVWATRLRAVKASCRGASCRDDGGAREAAVGTRREGEAALSGRATRCPDSGFKPLHRRGTWQPRGSGALPRVPGEARDG
jgi:hypothetical protein